MKYFNYKQMCYAACTEVQRHPFARSSKLHVTSCKKHRVVPCFVCLKLLSN